jgi:hypothetical protein
MDSGQIKALFIVVVAALFAIYLGVAAATAQTEAVAWVAALLGLAFVLALGRNVWAFIPVTLMLAGTINAVPGTPPVWAAATAVCGIIYMLRLALRRPDFTFRFDALDVVVVLQLVAIGQAYVRNPTGLLMFGGDVAGGKSYFLFVVAVMAYFGISLAKPDKKVFKRVVILMILAAIGDGLLITISEKSANVAAAVLPIYSNVSFHAAAGGDVVRDLAISRGGLGYSYLGKALAMPCICLLRPLLALSPTRPLFFAATMTGGALMLLSGFRSGAAYLAVVFIVSAMMRRKISDVVVVAFASIMALAVLLMSGSLRELPFGVQRVLSILPVDVSSAAKADAEDSTRWRVEMWKLALGTDRYIHNKLWGDGFAINSREMQAILDQMQGVATDSISSQDRMLAQGSYHGFHVETIRFTGIFGLICAVVMMVVAFRKALRLVRAYRHHELFPYVVYICIPFAIYPFWAMAIFGSYRTEFPQYLAMAGMLKMLENLRRSEAAVPVARTEAPPMPGSRMGRLPAPAYGAVRSANA